MRAEDRGESRGMSQTMPMRRHTGRTLLTGAALLALAGCSQIGDPLEALGARPPAPDEFKIVTRAPLVVPRSVEGQQAAALPRPDPGRPTPLEPDPTRAAAVALLGPTAVVGEAAAPSRGERVLLDAATQGAQADIRETLTEETAARNAEDANAPYDPPSVAELLGIGGSDPDAPDPDTLVDPVAESQRLQRSGIPAPADPTAIAAAAAEAEAEDRPNFAEQNTADQITQTNRSVRRRQPIIE